MHHSLASTCIRVAAALALLSPAAAQVERAWIYQHDVPGTLIQIPNELIPTEDGGFLALQTSEDPGAPNYGNSDVLVTKFSANGDREWIFRKPSSYGNSFMRLGKVIGALDAEENLYLALSGPYPSEILKLSPSGDLLWQRSANSLGGGVPFWPQSVVIGAAGEILIGGTHDAGTYPFTRIFALDPAGNVLWWRGDQPGVLHELLVAPNGDLVAYGQTDYDSFNRKGLVLRYSPNGNLLWSVGVGSGVYTTSQGFQEFDDRVDDAVLDAAGNLYCIINGVYGAGYHLGPGTHGYALVSLSATGGVRYSTDVIGTGESFARRIVLDRSEQNVYVVGSASDCVGSCVTAPTVWKYDSVGSETWKRRPAAGATASGEMIGARVTNGDMLVTTGYRTAGANTTAMDVVFAPDGSEPWSRDRVGSSAFDSSLERFDVLADERDNSFVVGRAGEGIVVTKLLTGSSIGSTYCTPAASNSTGVPAELRAAGSDVRTLDNVTLLASDLPGGTFVLFLASRAQGSAPGAGGSQGTLCLGGAIGRYVGPGEIRRATTTGVATLQIDLDTIPQPTGPVSAMAGETWYAQAWYRDVNPGVTSNLTNGIAITLQ